ncbi:MAG: LysE family transporter, partial [Spirochaetaceae bacterium]|nr:LysE family transporter [Spirochaetaceae bacterium]
MFPWLSFLSYVTIAAFTPGPNNIMSMNNAKLVGFKRGVVFNFGILAGIFIITLLCLLFSALLFSVIPKIAFPMKALGAAYMLFLIVKTLMPAGKKSAASKKSGGSFVAGMILQLVNPKIIIYGITGVSSFVLPYYREPFTLILFALLMAVIGFSGTLCWA